MTWRVISDTLHWYTEPRYDAEDVTRRLSLEQGKELKGKLVQAKDFSDRRFLETDEGYLPRENAPGGERCVHLLRLDDGNEELEGHALNHKAARLRARRARVVNRGDDSDYSWWDLDEQDIGQKVGIGAQLFYGSVKRYAQFFVLCSLLSIYPTLDNHSGDYLDSQLTSSCHSDTQTQSFTYTSSYSSSYSTSYTSSYTTTTMKCQDTTYVTALTIGNIRDKADNRFFQTCVSWMPLSTVLLIFLSWLGGFNHRMTLRHDITNATASDYALLVQHLDHEVTNEDLIRHFEQDYIKECEEACKQMEIFHANEVVPWVQTHKEEDSKPVDSDGIYTEIGVKSKSTLEVVECHMEKRQDALKASGIDGSWKTDFLEREMCVVLADVRDLVVKYREFRDMAKDVHQLQQKIDELILLPAEKKDEKTAAAIETLQKKLEKKKQDSLKLQEQIDFLKAEEKRTHDCLTLILTLTPTLPY